MTIFASFASQLADKKSLSKGDLNAREGMSKSYFLEDSRELINILNSPKENGKFLIKDLIYSEPEIDLENFTKFNKIMINFMNNTIIQEPENLGKYKKAWIRIYPKDFIVTQFRSSEEKYTNFDISKDNLGWVESMTESRICDPKSQKGLFSKEGAYTEFVVGNKKVVLCVEYK
jgi:hypothetical protein